MEIVLIGWTVFAASLLAIAGVVYSKLAREIGRARVRVGTGSKVFNSRFGLMEYAMAGDGLPAIMIHGTGGGFDQG